MKRILTIAFAVLLSSTMSRFAFAHQDQSFTNVATAGIFEDTYDYFKANPAYMPGFQKNTFWGQLSNLQSRQDSLFANQTVNSLLSAFSTDLTSLIDLMDMPTSITDGLANLTSDNYYLAGTQFDIGMGRVGLMLDWTGYVRPRDNRAFREADTHKGFGDISTTTFRDSDGDGEFNYARQTYGKSDRSDCFNANDIYAAYGLGMVGVADLGIGIRGKWNSYTPTYDPFNSYAEMINPSFNLKSTDIETDYETHHVNYQWEENGSGSLNYGNSTWELILGGKMQNIIPNLGIVASVTPKLITTTNSYTWDYNSNTITGAVYQSVKNIQERGIENDSSLPLPGTGFGVDVNVRGDYTYTPTTIFIGELGVGTDAWKSKDAKKDSTYATQVTDTTFVPLPVSYSDNYSSVVNDTYDSKNGDFSLAGRLRAQFLNTGWKWGLGLNAGFQTYTSEETHTHTLAETTTYTDNSGIPHNSYVTKTNGYSKDKTNVETITNTIEFPMGMSIDLAKNVSLQLGVKHVIYTRVNTTDSKPLEYAPSESITTYGDGVVGSPVYASSYLSQGSRTSTLTMTHVNNFNYGLTWWPYENLQLDVTGFGSFFDAVSLFGYKVSTNIYF